MIMALDETLRFLSKRHPTARLHQASASSMRSWRSEISSS